MSNLTWRQMAKGYWRSAGDHAAQADARVNVAFAEDKPGRCVLSREEQAAELRKAKHHREQAQVEALLALGAIAMPALLGEASNSPAT